VESYCADPLLLLVRKHGAKRFRDESSKLAADAAMEGFTQLGKVAAEVEYRLAEKFEHLPGFYSRGR
jgi:hypothetical protein